MNIKNYILATGIATMMFPMISNAQTIATFDDLSLPGADTNFANTQAQGDYSFQSGNVLFYGELTSWGGYSGFNFSNIQDDSTQDYTNDKSAITGIGFDSSANYGLCFVPLDFQGADPAATVPVGAKLEDDAAGHPVEGAYITNTTYAYWYMVNNFQSGNWFKLTVRGYLNGVQTPDSIVFTLGQVNDSSSNILNTWTWLDMTALGNVDSLTFDLSSNDTAGGFGMNNPAYFAIDNLTTADTDSSETIIHYPTVQNLSFSFFPNPVHTELYINAAHPLTLAVYNLAGKRVSFRKNAHSLNVAQLPNGVYILKAGDEQNNKWGSRKFIKQ